MLRPSARLRKLSDKDKLPYRQSGQKPMLRPSARLRKLSDKDKPPYAIADFNEAIRLSPNYAWAYAQRGGAYLA